MRLGACYFYEVLSAIGRVRVLILIRVKREAVAAAVRGVSVIATHDAAHWHKADMPFVPFNVRL